MADEILVFEGSKQGNRTTFTVLFLFPITTPVQTGSPGSNVVPTPVPRDEASAIVWPYTLLTSQEQGDLDGGTQGFTTIRFAKDLSLTNAELIAELQKLYSENLVQFSDAYDARYEHIGLRLNA